MQTIRQTGEELKEGDYTDVDLANVSLIQNLPHAIKDFDPKPWVAINRPLQTRLVRKNLGKFPPSGICK